MIKSVLNFFGSFFTGGINDARTFLSDMPIGPEASSGEIVTPERANCLDAYYAAIRCISEDIAKLPLEIRERLPDGKSREAFEHPAYGLLNLRANPELGAMNYREIQVARALALGNGISIIQRDGSGTPIAFWPKHTDDVRVRRVMIDGIMEKIYIVKNEDRSISVYPAIDVLHVRGPGDENSGYSIARLAMESIGHGLAMQKFGASFFGNGAAPGGVLTYPETMDDQAYKRLRKSWQAAYAGAKNAGRVAILENGTTYNKITIPPNEAQYVESQQFNVETIARWFRMPPHKLQHLLRATFANIEEQNLEYVVDTLLPWAKRVEEETEYKVLGVRPGTIGRYYVRHNFRELMRGDAEKRANFYQKLFYIGALSPNEIRRLEDMDPYDGGDKYFVQGATVPIELAGKVFMKSQDKSLSNNQENDTQKDSKNGNGED